MLRIPCPWCGPRDEIEFRYGGQAHVTYPVDPDALSDEEWADYLFMRDNPRGPFRERWFHAPAAAAGSTWCGTPRRTRSTPSIRSDAAEERD